MIDAIVSFLLQYKYILFFYAIIVVLVILNWKKIDVQSKIILLYRTKWGLSWMENTARRFRQWIILLGYTGTGIGFIGMIFIIVILVKNVYDLISTPAATPGVSIVLPGVNVPGIGVLPFWYWLIAIFIIAIVHEFAHGIVARAHNIPVKNTGIVFLGPIIGAFVEPDENKLRSQKDINQYSVLAAGAFSNILLAVVVLLMLNLVTTPLQQQMVEPTGFTFDAYFGKDLPAENAGLPPGTLITGIDSTEVREFQQFSDKLQCALPGQTITIKTPEKQYPITLAPNPDAQEKGFLGISQVRNEVQVKEAYQSGIGNVAYTLLDWFNGLFRWLFLLSLGIGLFNLLPLPIVDGGRMAQVFLHSLKGPEEGERRYRQISIAFLLLLALSLLLPLFTQFL
ncbi:MAG: site-2 protease family protein [Nanoarchaeota archaeon]